MLRSPLRWVGGKSRLRDTIISRFPPHICYVEVFGGAAWVLFGKDPSTSRSEVLNDLDGDLVNFWRVVKHRSAEFTEMASWLIASRELFEEWRPLPPEKDEVWRALRFYAVIRMAFGAKRTHNHFGMRRTERPAIYWPTVRDDVERIVSRLRLVWIESEPWDQCIDRYDQPATFFYADPPYVGSASKNYQHNMRTEDHEALAERLARAKAKWLLSYGDHSSIVKLYRRRGITIERVRVRYGLQGGLGPAQRELLIRNY